MGFIEKLSNILKRENLDELKWSLVYEEEYIKIKCNRELSKLSKIQDLMNMYELYTKKDEIILEYDKIYDLYYDEFDNAIDMYTTFNLPQIFNGILEVENRNNFLVDEEVFFTFRFKSGEDIYTIENGNILTCELNDEYKVLPKKLYKLVKMIKEYNTSYDKRKNTSEQFEMLKKIKEYAQKIDIKLNERLKKEEAPVIIDKLKVDFNDDGQNLTIYPKLSDDESINNELLQNIEDYKEVKDTYSTSVDGKRVRYVVKHKESLKNILSKKTVTGEERLNVLSGKSELFQDENIDISAFGPRVTGYGYITYRKSSSGSNLNKLNWLDTDVDMPYIQGTNISGDYENITLKPRDIDNLQKSLDNILENNTDKSEVVFTSDNGKKVNIIMSKQDIEDEIVNIKSRIKTVDEINDIAALKTISRIADKYKNEEYIPYKSIYIDKTKISSSYILKDNIADRIEEIKNAPKRKYVRKKSLLIAENFSEDEYDENENGDRHEREVEIPTTLNENIKLFDYQAECLKKLQNIYLSSKVNGFLLCDDMGLGKTLQLLSFLAWVKERGELTPSLIVAPSSLLNNWDGEPSGEIQKFFKKNYFSTDRITETITDEKVEELKKKDIVFITYDCLRINNVALGKINWKVMICDEAQKIKSPRTLVTVAAKAQNADFKIICSATPIENSLEDLWTLVDFSKPGLLGSLKDFKTRYITSTKNVTPKELEDMNNELYNKIEKFYIRREKDILPKTLPTKRIKLYYSKPTVEEVNALESIKDTEDYTISAIQKMLAICSHVDTINENVPTRANINSLINKSSKMMIVKDILKDVQIKDEKVIIFTRLRKVQKILYYAVKEWFNIDPYIVNGDDNNLDARTKKINEFRFSKGFNVIILSPEVAGFGITIIEANHVIHYTRLWNPAKEDQATDRVYRIGQTKDVTVHYPMVSFEKDETYEYTNINEYVSENSRVDDSILSAEEKLNILLARKKGMLLRFFLSAGGSEIDSTDFKALENNKLKSKNNIILHDNFNNVFTTHEFEAIIAVLYERMGFKTYLTNNDKGINIIAIKDNEISFVKCKHTLMKVGLQLNKEIKFARKTYKNVIDANRVKNVLVTSTNLIEESLYDISDLYIINRKDLGFLLKKHKILKNEVDLKNKERYAFEQMYEILREI